jgi:hypothetical protein
MPCEDRRGEPAVLEPMRSKFFGYQRSRITPQILRLTQHGSEYMVPERCADTVVSRCEFMMALVMFEQW